MRLRTRFDVGRRLSELEGTFGGLEKCRCRVRDSAPLWAQSIVSASPDDYPDLDTSDGPQWGRVVCEPCPDCGRERLVYVTRMPL